MTTQKKDFLLWFKDLAFPVLVTIILGFGTYFLKDIEGIKSDVKAISTTVSKHDQKLVDISDDMKDMKGDMKSLLKHIQLHDASEGDEVYNNFGTTPPISNMKYACKFVDQ